MRRSKPCAALAAGALAFIVAFTSTGVSSDRGDYDPLSAARASAGKFVNEWATIPAQCWTKTDEGANPCWSCHVPALPPNELADWNLQETIQFPRPRLKNPWTNLFVDRRAAVAAISDEEILGWVREDNYSPLRDALARSKDYAGFAADLDFASGFDEAGFARDGSGWRALRYKPFPGAFWPTNGSTDDVFVRLPAEFRRDAEGRASADVYRANLAILEAALASDPYATDARVEHPVEPVDEKAAGADLDGDGVLGTAVRIRPLPARFVGGAGSVAVRRRLYPVGTEFLHSVRYLDPDAPSLTARRMKELRYSRKDADLPPRHRAQIYSQLKGEEEGEAAPEPPPEFEGSALTGLRNEFGWRLQAFIEDASGRLRLQTDEEHLHCMGCHTTLGVTVDHTFSFPRKLPGAEGWRPQDLRGQADAPQAGHAEGEVLEWVRRAQGGDEFRGNEEFARRFLPRGKLDETALRRAAPGGDRDLAWVLAPSRARALTLDKAYLVLVREQSFARGRDPSLEPVRSVHEASPDATTGLREAQAVRRDGRLLLDWTRSDPGEERKPLKPGDTRAR